MLILCIVSLWRKLAGKVASSGFLVVVPDFFYGDPITNFNDPKFDRESWRKVHNTVCFLLLSCYLWDGHMQNCAIIKKASRAHIDLPLMSKLNVLFVTLVEIEWLLICYVWLTFLIALIWIWTHFPSRIKDMKMPNLWLRLWRVKEFLPLGLQVFAGEVSDLLSISNLIRNLML